MSNKIKFYLLFGTIVMDSVMWNMNTSAKSAAIRFFTCCEMERSIGIYEK